MLTCIHLLTEVLMPKFLPVNQQHYFIVSIGIMVEFHRESLDILRIYMKTRQQALFCFPCRGRCQKSPRDIDKGGFTCFKAGWSDTQRPTLLSLVTSLGTASCGLLHLWGRNHVGWKSAAPFHSAKHFYLFSFADVSLSLYFLLSFFLDRVLTLLLLMLLFCFNQEPKNM